MLGARRVRSARRDPPRPSAGDRLGREGGLRSVDRLGRADARRAARLERRDRDLPAHHEPARPAGGRGALGPAARRRGVLLVAAAWARRTPDATVARSRARPRRPRRGDAPALATTFIRLLPGVGPSRRRWWVGRASTAPGAWSTTAPSRPGLAPGPARAGHRRCRELLAHRGRRDLDVPAARALGGDARHPPLAHPLGATPPLGVDGLSMPPLGVSAVTLGFGFLITLGSPPLDLRDSPR